MAHRYLLPLIVAILVAICSTPSSSAGGSTEIRFTYRSGLIWIPIQVDGHRQALNFLLDSGAEQSVIDRRAAKKLGLQFVGTEVVSRVHGDETAYKTGSLKLQLDGQVSSTASLLALDLSAESRSVRGTIDGLLGMDFMAGRVIQIDYQSEVLRLDPPASAKSGHAIPMSLNRGNPCITVKIDGSHTLPRVRIDTGCNQSLHWSTTASHENSRSRGMRTIGSSSQRTRTQKNDVALGASIFKKVATTLHPQPIFSGEQGLLGNLLLARFGVVTFDFARRRLILGRG